MDSHGLFSGSDYAAAKVAGHELKGLKAYFSLGLFILLLLLILVLLDCILLFIGSCCLLVLFMMIVCYI